MKKTIVMQVLIFIIAWFVMTPDVMQDNTHLFGLIGDVEIIKGNAHWVFLGAMIVSIANIWFWWPKAQGVVNTSSESSTPIVAKGTKSAEAKAEETTDLDPKTPTLD